MRIKVNNIKYELNGSLGAREFYESLPLKVAVEDFGGNEKIFYPSSKLATSNLPKAKMTKGVIAYYQPWGNIALFYEGNDRPSPGLYQLGTAVENLDHLRDLNGKITIERDED